VRHLLDTQALLWWMADAPQLSAAARSAIASSVNQSLVSAASGWGISVRYRLGRLGLLRAPERLVPHHLTLNGFDVLPVTLAHALGVGQLPLHHRDPFDRMLIAQSVIEKLPLITRDPAFSACDVEVLW
jgi:PIN domain nuclease of toxin-antitoxin system